MEEVRPLNDQLMPIPAASNLGELQKWNYYDTTEIKSYFKSAIDNLEFQNHHIRNYEHVLRILSKSERVMNTLDEILFLLDSEIAQK